MAGSRRWKFKSYTGNDTLLFGIVLALLTFWLFASSMGTVAPQILADVNKNGEHMTDSGLNFAVSITALMSGLLIVLMGGLADRFGRVKIALIGIVGGIIGSLFLVFAIPALMLPMMVIGRAIQGFSAACVMPATLAIVNSYWDGEARQRAVSIWSMGTWGGAGLSAIFGGLIVQFVGWRGLFVAHILISVIAFLIIRRTPETKAENKQTGSFDYRGFSLFVLWVLAFMVIVLFGSQLGWVSPVVLILGAVGILALVGFVVVEARKRSNPFIDFRLFKNKTFTGSTVANFLMNCSIGLLIISQQVIQIAGLKEDGSQFNVLEAGLLSLGYGIFVIAFIRTGEKFLQKYGPRRPMMWGTLILIVVAAMLMLTNLKMGQYQILSIAAYCLFGLGVAFFATPSTDAALDSLPDDQAGAGSGIYKMASSLGSAVGTAITMAVFSATTSTGVPWLREIFSFAGHTHNVEVREAGMLALGVNLVLMVLAFLSVLAVPRTLKKTTQDDAAVEADTKA